MGYFFSLSKSAASLGLEVSELVLVLSGIVLVIGIVGEYDKLPNWLRRGLISSKTACAVLVIVAVTGEFFSDAGVWLFSQQLQSISNGEVVWAEHDATCAAESAKAAQEQAKRASIEAASAIAKAGNADQRAAADESKAAELNKLAQDERLEVLRLQVRLSPRAVSAQQRDALIEKARSVKLGTPVIVRSDLFAGLEAKAYAGQITGALSKAGIAAILSPDDTTNPLLSGIFVCASKSATNQVKKASVKLRDILLAAGFPKVNAPEQGLGVRRQPVPCTTHDADPNPIWLIVGSK